MGRVVIVKRNGMMVVPGTSAFKASESVSDDLSEMVGRLKVAKTQRRVEEKITGVSKQVNTILQLSRSSVFKIISEGQK